jgi:hypothetical protein
VTTSAESLHPAEKNVVQYPFFHARQNIRDRMKKRFPIGEFISSQELLNMAEKRKVRQPQIWRVWRMWSYFHPVTLHKIQRDLCNMRTLVIGVHDEFLIRPSDLSSVK